MPSNGFTRIESDSTDTILEGASVELRDGNYLQAGIATRIRDAALKSYERIFLIAALPFITISFLGGWIIASRTTRPVNRLIESARMIIETGKMSDRIDMSGKGDELDTLVNLYNTMLGKIEGAVEGMRGALDSVAHELRTPLTRFRNVAELALDDGNRESEQHLREALESGLDESSQMISTLRLLMDISEAESGIMSLDRETVDLADVVRSALDLYAHVADEKGISVDFSHIDSVSADVDASRVRQAAANLLDNAVKYTPADGTVTISCGEENDSACIRVSDTGIGIPSHELGQVWNRLSRGEEVRNVRGQGLGLSLVKAIVEAHGGSVSAESEKGVGSTFTILLPLSG